MQVSVFLTPYMQSLSYVVSEDRYAVLIDPCEMDEIKDCIRGMQVQYAFLTHEHYDHISGVDWARGIGAQIIASDICNINLGDARLNHSKYYGAFCAAQERLKKDEIQNVKAYTTYADLCFSENMQLLWQKHTLMFRKTPGHSSGGACLLVDGSVLFSGDTLFKSVNANVDLMCGNCRQLEESVEWILSLPDETIVYPGHYEMFKIKDRRRRS